MRSGSTLVNGMFAVLAACACVWLIPGSARGQAWGDRPLKMRLFDHNYGDFNGEFDRTMEPCAYDVQSWLPGMVGDSLAFDARLGKKLPRKGLVSETCSDSLEKWFDPGASRLSVCGELPVATVPQGKRPVYSFNSETFFPMDSRSVQPDLNGENDYTFCMEINAGFTARGGELLKFRGDDDLWVYLDGRLVIDRGGMHYHRGDTVLVDTLAGSAAKLGRYRNLDVYFCSRLPNTSVFGMEAPLDPEPLVLQSLRIADTAGKELTSRDVMIGRTRVCAGAVFQAPDPAACGNFAAATPFTAASWEFNGQILSGGAATECVDLDPGGLPHGTRAQLTARSGDKTARITLTVARIAKVKDGVIRGNGRAEFVDAPVDSGTGVLSEGLDIEFFFAGRTRFARAFPVAGAALMSGVLGSGEAGPEGLTGFPAVPAVTRQTHFGRTVLQEIRLVDGMGPVLTAARVRWADSGAGPATGAYLEWEASEPLGGAVFEAGDLLGRRAGRTWAGLSGLGVPAAPGAAAVGAGRVRYRIPLDLAAANAFRPGDSLSLGPKAADSLGNAAGRFFVPVALPGRLEGASGSFRFADNPARGRMFVPVPGLPAVILVSPQRLPLKDQDADRRVSEAGGPVLLLPALSPLRRIALSFFDHLGAAVGSADLEISPADWELVRRASPGDTTWVGLRWYPVSSAGGKLGTGAYIVRGQVWTRDGALVQAADGSWSKVQGATARFGPSLFGYLRE